MKIKKLLSIGALAVVLASSLSIGAPAADTTISKSALLIKIVANQYNNGQNQTGLLSGVNKNTVVGTIVSDGFVNKVDTTYGSYSTVDKALTKYDNNKTETVAQVLAEATKDEATFDRFKSDVVTVLTKLEGMDSKSGQDRSDTETTFAGIVKAYNSDLTVSFGKNGAGETIADLKNSGQLVVELSSQDLQDTIDKVNSTTWNEVQTLKAEN